MGKLPSPFRLPERNVEVSTIPDSFDARTKWGSKCPSLNEIRDQGPCGSCWAVAAAEAITDRTCIGSDGATKIDLSAQDITSCCGECGSGCDGGYIDAAWSYWTTTGVVTGGSHESKFGCFPYGLAECSHHVNGTFPACGDEQPTPACKKSCQNGADWNGDKHKGASSYSVSGVNKIQTEIMTNGPVEAGFSVYADFLAYKTGVYQHVTGSMLGGHAVKILGWGVENKTPYWIVANSWNDQWGDKGYFKIKRGDDECGIESEISAGLLKSAIATF